MRIPRNRAVVMPLIDVSQSIRATGVQPSRRVDTAKQFADVLAYAALAALLINRRLTT